MRPMLTRVSQCVYPRPGFSQCVPYGSSPRTCRIRESSLSLRAPGHRQFPRTKCRRASPRLTASGTPPRRWPSQCPISAFKGHRRSRAIDVPTPTAPPLRQFNGSASVSTAEVPRTTPIASGITPQPPSVLFTLDPTIAASAHSPAPSAGLFACTPPPGFHPHRPADPHQEAEFRGIRLGSSRPCGSAAPCPCRAQRPDGDCRHDQYHLLVGARIGRRSAR